MNIKSVISIIAGFGLLFGACEKNNDMAEQTTDQGTMKVSMTDAPANYNALNVRINKAEVYLEGQGWVQLENRAQQFDVLELNNGQTIEIASSTQLRAGTYSRLRLEFAQEVNLTTLASVGLPGSEAEGTFQLMWKGSNTLEIEINEQVEIGSQTDVLLDFDAARSVMEDGNDYYIQPVIRYVQNTSTGISGQLEGSAQAMIIARNGEFEASAYAAVDGEFMIRGLADGTYDLTIEYLQNVDGQLEYGEKEVRDVTVTQGHITMLGTVYVK